MLMDADDKLYLIVRCLGAAGGLIGGAICGTILHIVLMIITDSSFGLANIWPGTVGGAIIGMVLGFLFPRVGKFLMGLFADVQ
jgi:hypothetical protein